jgi:hypothetical protein
MSQPKYFQRLVALTFKGKEAKEFAKRVREDQHAVDLVAQSRVIRNGDAVLYVWNNIVWDHWGPDGKGNTGVYVVNQFVESLVEEKYTYIRIDTEDDAWTQGTLKNPFNLQARVTLSFINENGFTESLS